jgi:uncharacterized protein
MIKHRIYALVLLLLYSESFISGQELAERDARVAATERSELIDQAHESSLASLDLPKMKMLKQDLKPFEYVDVGPEIPNYSAGRGATLNLMQLPVPSSESMEHMVTPEGMLVELFADESMPDGLGGNGKMFSGKPIAMTWDAEGRLWVCETLDYPNELKPPGEGRDRIRTIEDTDGDMRADKSIAFAEGLSIPTAIAFHRGGVVAQNGVETLYLKDTNGDGKADVRKVLMNNWTLGDTHGGVSNFRNGLDNWIWAMQGYNPSEPILNPTAPDGGQKIPSFRMGFFRFKLSQDDDPIVEAFEFVRSTTNNTWGLGISEEGLIFGSTANRQPSFFMPIANRYYERVNGWAPETLEMMCPTHLFQPITDKIRQVDHHGGYTAAAGHAIYTARNYPPAYWNRTAFVCGPTGKLVGTFVIQRTGAGMKSRSPNNLLASDDEWTAPIMAEVGPDGNVWVLDWYNYIVQHNPTPQGFETGAGKAYETKLRDKKYGRIYRVIPDSVAQAASQHNSPRAKVTPQAVRDDTAALLSGLRSPTMLVRLHAQRLLVERCDLSVVPDLIKLIEDFSVDEIGLNPPAMHALHTLDGLGVFNEKGPARDAVITALKHPSAGVRLNALRVLPNDQTAIKAIATSKAFEDRDDQVVLASLLKLSDVRGTGAGELLRKAALSDRVGADRWLGDALASAGAMHAQEFLANVFKLRQPLPAGSLNSLQRVSEHMARGRITAEQFSQLLEMMVDSEKAVTDALILGLGRGWPIDHQIAINVKHDAMLAELFQASSPRAQGELARLATSLSSKSLQKSIQPMIAGMLETVKEKDMTVAERLASAKAAIDLAPSRVETVDALCELIGPQISAELSIGLMAAIAASTDTSLSDRLLAYASEGTPAIRATALDLMLGREIFTQRLLKELEKGRLKFSDLSPLQRSSLTNHPVLQIARQAEQLMRLQGASQSNDRQKLLNEKAPLTERKGDPERGKAIFSKNCASCHVFKGEGKIVGPNLNGMSVHPKIELLKHILDPNSSVEANYRLYNVLTIDGKLISGVLSGETLTSIEMIDAQGKAHLILREDIEELKATTKSAMPEGLEQTVDDIALVDLLEYLTQAEKFIPLGLESIANVLTIEGMFTDRNNPRERLRLPAYGRQVIQVTPFDLIDPNPRQSKNGVMLYGPRGPFAPAMPKRVSIRCRMAAEKVHLLAGIAGWPGRRGTAMIVRLHYSDGQVEDHPLEVGKHIADYIQRSDVPESTFAIASEDGGQVRYLAISPKRPNVIDSIELVKPDHDSAPLVLAITVEQHGFHGKH